jgi:1-phosphatidylinositol-3-phosphate 5-kinase
LQITSISWYDDLVLLPNAVFNVGYIQEEQFETMEPVNRKALPRLPSVDEAYVFDEDEVEEHPTPKPAISGLPDVSTSGEYDEPKTPTATAPSSPRPDIGKRLPTDKTLPRDKALPVNSFALLARLRHSLQKVEQKLYADLARTPTSTLNDTRRAFRSTAKGATKRIHAWQDKHLPKKRGAEHAFSKLITPEPSWWSAQCYAVPGGSVIVHEEDWGSIIAFTLSCTDYMRELANFTNSRTSTAMSEMTQMSSMAPSFATSTPTSPLPTPGTPGPILKLSYFTAPFRTNPRPDPDQDDDIHWQDSETCSAVISRQEYRDPTYLVSLKEALLSKRPASGASGSITSQLMSRGSLKGPNGTPASAWAKPAVEVSLQAVDGVVIEPIGGETAEKLRHELEESSTDRSSILSASSASASEFVETHLRRGKLASLVSAESDSESEATESGIRSLAADNKIPSDSPSAWKGRNDDRQARPSSEPGADLDHDRAEAQSMSITSSLSQAMRMVLRAGDTLRSFPTSSNPNSKTHHALLSVDSLGTVDDRPHLKHDFTVGKMRFSCTVYYAKQFDTLRRKCGIEDVFVQSMRKSANWAADGGKSKSNFWKTSDDRFIIKTLVNAWNVADL